MDFNNFNDMYDAKCNYEHEDECYYEEKSCQKDKCHPKSKCEEILCQTEFVPFCCCVTVPDGFEPVGICPPEDDRKHDYHHICDCECKDECEALILPCIVKNCARLICEPSIVRDVPIKTPTGKICCDVTIKKIRLCGPVVIQLSLLTRKCNEYKFFSCCAKALVDKVLCFKCPNYKNVNVSKVHVCVDLDSLKAELLPENCCTCDKRFKLTGCLKVCVEICPCY